jgi:hypothetical protein
VLLAGRPCRSPIRRQTAEAKDAIGLHTGPEDAAQTHLRRAGTLASVVAGAVEAKANGNSPATIEGYARDSNEGKRSAKAS